MKTLPTRIDRYPAKMVGRLADKLIDRYTAQNSKVLDPFCGSGAILTAARVRGRSVFGADINPYGVLLSSVKLNGFDAISAKNLFREWTRAARTLQHRFPISWDSASYWFGNATIRKFEELRFAARKMKLGETPEGRANLLALALSVRTCSKADSRSPKPFISKAAIAKKSGKHLNPYTHTESLLCELGKLYGVPAKETSRVAALDVVREENPKVFPKGITHVITSPPYINAQDYFRNFKLELYILEGLLPYDLAAIRTKFIGTERGTLIDGLDRQELELNRELLPLLVELEQNRPRSAAVIHRYFSDMSRVFRLFRRVLAATGIVVLVCGDNLVAGRAIKTFEILNKILELEGFRQFDQFGDEIARRQLAPQRSGHKGLIKSEIVTAFQLSK